jgi:hypothetical protein
LVLARDLRLQVRWARSARRQLIRQHQVLMVLTAHAARLAQ